MLLYRYIFLQKKTNLSLLRMAFNSSLIFEKILIAFGEKVIVPVILSQTRTLFKILRSGLQGHGLTIYEWRKFSSRFSACDDGIEDNSTPSIFEMYLPTIN